MRLSFKAFKDWIDFTGTAFELGDILAGLGFPNDGVSVIGEGLDQVIVGKVLTKSKHPQADRLSLLTVDTGSEQLPIVCGASNMSIGDLVALAPVGATIPGKDGSGMTMREAKIRGEVSKGMCCSEVELRLSEEGEGILILPKDRLSDQDLGKKVSEVLDLQDWILDIDVTPNRGDALSIRGLAREAGAKLGLKVKNWTSMKWKNPVSTVKPSIESFGDASGFAACLVQGVVSGPSPQNWQIFLRAIGARSISNLVDITNIVMFELGHPIHFFDADKIDPLSICVRRAKLGETLEVLSGKVLKLDPEDLVIADKSGALSLAGVMGGLASSVTETTKNILIEVAAFDPKRIRATARRHDLHSESSARFERGVTIYDFDEVIDRSLFLLKEISTFEMAGGTKITDRQIEPKSILWDRARIESKLGKIQKTDDELFEILRRLEYSFEPKGSTVRVIFPWYRTDVEVLEDVMEDIARLLGYETLETKPLVAAESVHVRKDLVAELSLADSLLDRFVAQGFSEVIHLSFTNPTLETKFGFSGDDFVSLQNPIHSEKSVLRRSLLPELILRAKMNADNNEDEIRLVEVGPVFSNQKGDSAFGESPMREKWAIACVWLPRPSDKKRLWSRNADPYYEFKGLAESVWSRVKVRPTKDFQSPMFFPKRVVKTSNGVAGELHPTLMKALDISGRCFIGEWIIQGKMPKTEFVLPTIYPAVDLDASFVAKKDITVVEVMDVFLKAKVPFLESVRPYDLFSLESEKKSLTFAMRYRDHSRTLTLDEAKKSHEALVSAALKTLAAYQIALR